MENISSTGLLIGIAHLINSQEPLYSTTQQLLVFLHTIQKSFSSNSQTDVIYLDFKKAFDSVAHNELLVKLWSFGITGNLWKWFRAYLSGRSQRVRLNHCMSDPLPVLSGVPQGSILGPLLFLIFVNDIPSAVRQSSIYLYADDTKCLMNVCSSADCRLLQNDIFHLSSWSKKWNLYFNGNKCVLLRFCSKFPHVSYDYTISNMPIKCVESYRDLGITMSSNLQWRDHINYISSRAYRMLGLIRRCFSSDLDPATKLSLYIHLTCPLTTNLLFSDMATSSAKGYLFLGAHPATRNKVHSPRLSL